MDTTARPPSLALPHKGGGDPLRPIKLTDATDLGAFPIRRTHARRQFLRRWARARRTREAKIELRQPFSQDKLGERGYIFAQAGR